jgi:uncharacterized membrane protein YkoI
MDRRTRWAVAAAIVVAGVGGGAGAAAAAGVADGDTPITGPALERASTAALAATGGGRVTETEVDDEDAYYEVEVTLDDGRQVDVHLDRDFHVVGVEGDADTGGDRD